MKYRVTIHGIPESYSRFSPFHGMSLDRLHKEALDLLAVSPPESYAQIDEQEWKPVRRIERPAEVIRGGSK